MSKKQNFTDVDGRKIVCRTVEQNDFPYLEVAEWAEETDTHTRLMLLNMYDAKKLLEASQNFLSQTIAHNFAAYNGQLTPTDRNDMLDEE